MSIMARKRKVTLTYRDEKPEVYKLSQLTYPAVTYEQLLGMIQIVGVNQAQTRAVVSALLTSLVHYMELGHACRSARSARSSPRSTRRPSRLWTDWRVTRRRRPSR